MADNKGVTPGTGATFATDEIGGIDYPRVKTGWGPDGTFNDADVATGKPLPMQVRTATGLIPLGEPTDAKNPATDTTSVALIPILKQVSAELQLLRTALGSTALDLGSGTGGTRTLRAFIDTAQMGTLVGGNVPVVGDIKYVTVDMTAEATALDAGDVAAATQIVAACTPGNDVEAILQSIVVIDPDDQGAELNLVFMSANTTLGTEDAAPDIDDTEVQTVLGVINVATTDYKDLGANKVATLRNVGLPITPATGTDDIYVGIYTPGTPTYAGGHIYLRLGFI